MPKIVFYIAAAVLLFALVPLPYVYYSALRLCGFVLFSWLALLSLSNTKAFGFVLPFVGAAILFNPIVPIYLDRAVWMVIDFLAAMLLFAAAPRLGK